MAIAILVNLFAVSITAALNTISAWWHMAGVVFIVLVLLIVPDTHQSFGYVFGETINNSGFSGANFGDFMFLYVFGIGLLMAQYTITGFDASAHMAEETRQASRTAAVGMVMSVVVSVIFGFFLLLAVTFAIPDTQGVIDAGGYAVTYIWETSLGLDLGRDPADHRRLRADVLPDGIGDLGVADDVRVLARPRRSRPQALAADLVAARAALRSPGDRHPGVAADGADH